MSLIDDYMIPFFGLKEGVYDYSFEAEDDFFKLFENSEIFGGHLDIKLCLTRKMQLLELKFRINGSLNVLCDRCLSRFNHAVSTQNVLFIRFGSSFEEMTDEVLIIPSGETRINVAQYIYEFAVLSLPLQKIHPDNEDGSPGCDTGMLEKLKNHSPLGEGEEDNNIVDPRWDELKKMKFKN